MKFPLSLLWNDLQKATRNKQELVRLWSLSLYLRLQKTITTVEIIISRQCMYWYCRKLISIVLITWYWQALALWWRCQLSSLLLNWLWKQHLYILSMSGGLIDWCLSQCHSTKIARTTAINNQCHACTSTVASIVLMLTIWHAVTLSIKLCWCSCSLFFHLAPKAMASIPSLQVI